MDLLPFPVPGLSTTTYDTGLVALQAVVARMAGLHDDPPTQATPSKAPRRPELEWYEASRLTRILQTPLGGNSKTHVLCHISPGPAATPATQHTLGLGRGFRIFQNAPELNEASGAMVAAPLHAAAVWSVYEARRREAQAARGAGQRIGELIRIIKDGKVTLTHPQPLDGPKLVDYRKRGSFPQGHRQQLRTQLAQCQAAAQAAALRRLVVQGARSGVVLRNFRNWALAAMRHGRATSCHRQMRAESANVALTLSAPLELRRMQARGCPLWVC